MRAIVLAVGVICVGVGTSQAADSCKAQASAKKLAGAALTSFMTKCQRDAGAACETQAAGRKLAGAAKTSFTKKCTSDAVGI
jgi:hypothetical protein